jgi:prevent-host-death family protein
MESSSLHEAAPAEAGPGETAVKKAARLAPGAEILTWPYGYSHNGHMKTIAAGKFKDICLQTLDEVATQRRSVVITKRGRPVAKLVPITASSRPRSLAASIVTESGDPYGTGEGWDAGRS